MNKILLKLSRRRELHATHNKLRGTPMIHELILYCLHLYMKKKNWNGDIIFSPSRVFKLQQYSQNSEWGANISPDATLINFLANTFYSMIILCTEYINREVTDPRNVLFGERTKHTIKPKRRVTQTSQKPGYKECLILPFCLWCTFVCSWGIIQGRGSPVPSHEQY